MEPASEKPPFAWQPLTPRGVAAFARAPLGRVLQVQLIMALMSSATVVWCLHAAWFPTISKAIGQLPAQGEIRNGRLAWFGDSPECLAESRYLALTVNLKEPALVRSPAHVQFEFGGSEMRVFSILGFAHSNYPRKWMIAFNRTDLLPWWGAWSPAILAIVALVTIAGLMLAWALLATIYCLPVWLAGFFADRQLSGSGSWRLAAAGLIPGALVLTAAIFFYGSGALDVLGLMAAGAAHFVVAWFFIGAGVWRSPRQVSPVGLKGNPFV